MVAVHRKVEQEKEEEARIKHKDLVEEEDSCIFTYSMEYEKPHNITNSMRVVGMYGKGDYIYLSI